MSSISNFTLSVSRVYFFSEIQTLQLLCIEYHLMERTNIFGKKKKRYFEFYSTFKKIFRQFSCELIR